MKYKEFLDLQEKEFNFLNTLSLEKYITPGNMINISVIMDCIEEDYGKLYEEDFIFNCITREEFSEYLKNRYNISIVEQTEIFIITPSSEP